MSKKTTRVSGCTSAPRLSITHGRDEAIVPVEALGLTPGSTVSYELIDAADIRPGDRIAYVSETLTLGVGIAHDLTGGTWRTPTGGRLVDPSSTNGEVYRLSEETTNVSETR